MSCVDDLVLGKELWAIGNPFALGDKDDQPSVSRGVLSTGRVVRFNYPDCVQIDAPLNPGNSGGPCLSTEGKLLGINGMIRTRTGLRINSGIGIAIACTQLERLIPVLRQGRGGWIHRAQWPEGISF